MLPLILVILLAQSPSAQTADSCVAAVTAPALDHVVLVTRDLDRTAARFSALGFRLKPGRLHANRLLNRHIKFRDGSSIELMTVQGHAGDRMAAEYARLLASGDHGVYAALAVRDLAAVSAAAERLRLTVRRSSSGPWQFLSFDAGSPAASVFVSSGVPAVRDADSLTSHTPAAEGLREAWIEGGPELGALFGLLGGRRCATLRTADGRPGERWALGDGSIVIIPSRNGQPRVLGVVVHSSTLADSTVFPLPNFFVRYRNRPF